MLGTRALAASEFSGMLGNGVFALRSPHPTGVHPLAASPGQVLGPRGSRQSAPALQRGPGCLGGCCDILSLRLQAAG